MTVGSVENNYLSGPNKMGLLVLINHELSKG